MPDPSKARPPTPRAHTCRTRFRWGRVFASQAVIDSNLVPSLIHAMSVTSELRVRKEATWAIANATMGGTPEQIRYANHPLSLRPLPLP